MCDKLNIWSWGYNRDRRNMEADLITWRPQSIAASLQNDVKRGAQGEITEWINAARFVNKICEVLAHSIEYPGQYLLSIMGERGTCFWIEIILQVANFRWPFPFLQRLALDWEHMRNSSLYGFDDVVVQSSPFFKGFIEGDLPQLWSHRGLGQLNDCWCSIFYTIWSPLGVYDLSSIRDDQLARVFFSAKLASYGHHGTDRPFFEIRPTVLHGYARCNNHTGCDMMPRICSNGIGKVRIASPC